MRWKSASRGLFGLLLGMASCATAPDTPDPVALLDHANDEQRLHGFFLMDRATMVANLPRLLRMAVDDPSPAVRREVTRQLGYTRHPSVLEVLELALDGQLSEEAAESLGYVGTDGCAVLARRWVEAPRAPHGQFEDARLQRALRYAFTLHHPPCREALEALRDDHPRRVAELP